MQSKTGGKKPPKKPKISIRRLIQIASVLALAFSAYLLINYALMTARQKETQEQLILAYEQSNAPEATEKAEQTDIKLPEVIFSSPKPDYTESAAGNIAPTPEPAMAEKFVPLYRINSDVKGWLKVDAIDDINFPVVYKDNDFYLGHDFYYRKSAGGAAFLDVESSISPRSENLIIHAHNMKNGTMFGKLKRLLDINLFKSDPLASFDTLYEEAIYVPYAVSVVSLEENDKLYASIYEMDFSGYDAKSRYVNGLIYLSELVIPVDVSMDDELLTLITCHGREDKERLVVAYRKLREYENPQSIKEHIIENVRKSAR